MHPSLLYYGRAACRVFFCLFLLLHSRPVGASPAPDPVDEQLEALLQQSSQRDPRDGVATYYASKFIGRRTSSGERYHPDKLTAAHATLPLGTVVRVRNPKTGQDVVVRINDRCHPRHASRNLIDLSRQAAKQIGLWGKGLIRVQIIPLKERE